MKTGNVLIYHSKGLLPWLIRKFTKSYWNHAGIIGEKSDYGWIVYEAQAKGLVKSEYTTEFLNRRLAEGTIVELKSKYPIYNTKKHCESYLGTPYGITTLLQISWSIITKRTIKKSDGLKRLICSEFVARAIKDITLNKLDAEKDFNKKIDFITPDDLYNWDKLILIK